MTRERPRRRTYRFSSQQDHSTTVESNVMTLNEKRQVINEQENEVSISNTMIVLNEEEQSSLKAVMPINLKEITSSAEQLTNAS